MCNSGLPIENKFPIQGHSTEISIGISFHETLNINLYSLTIRVILQANWNDWDDFYLCLPLQNFKNEATDLYTYTNIKLFRVNIPNEKSKKSVISVTSRDYRRKIRIAKFWWKRMFFFKNIFYSNSIRRTVAV